MAMSAQALRSVIRAYKLLISPWLGANCRFDPTCSAYADTAIGRFGFWYGGYLAARRLLRCHPWGAQGYDPVPDRRIL